MILDGAHASTTVRGMPDDTHIRKNAQKVVAESGFSGLYRGVQAPLVGQMFFRHAS